MKILVSGAGIAGLSTAVNLGATGHDVTLIERANHLRVNGSPIDIRGDSIAVTAKMGVREQILAHQIDMTERAQFVDSTGTVVAQIPLEHMNDSADDIEIPREDLATILHNKLSSTTQLRFNESIAELSDDPDGVDVRFSSGSEERYDLVVGADGMHSGTRRLIFGPEQQFLRHLGFYVALAELPGHMPEGRTNPLYNFPGHLIGLATYNSTALAVFMFRSPWIEYDYHDLAAQKQILIETYGNHDEWRVPELLDAARQDPELYFDSVSQIHLPAWHQGHVVLVGDAAHCAANLSGRGTSLALTGAWLLTEALQQHPDDPQQALAQYEREQRPHATRGQATAIPGGDLIVPATQEQIDARNRDLSLSRT
ncbi:MAG: FAD-dependent monooxygenase [Mycobacterium sp.]